MIHNFKNRGLKRLFQRGVRSGLRPDIADKAEMYLTILDSAETIEELDIRGFGFHALRGNMQGLYSVYMSRNHRMIFRFENGEAADIDLVDYH